MASSDVDDWSTYTPGPDSAVVTSTTLALLDSAIPADVVEPVRTWLALLGGRNTSRGVVRRTTQGVWGTLREELLRLADERAQLHVAIGHGPSFPRGALRSASTRRAPYVQLVDVAPTVLDLMGLVPPPEMTGRSLIERS